MIMIKRIAILSLLVVGFGLPTRDWAAEVATTTLVIRHARVFDGHRLIPGNDNAILIGGGKVLAIQADSNNPEQAPPNTRVIDAGGRFVMPGLIDAHVHLTVVVGVPQLRDYDPGYISARAGVEARATLMRGFTTVRDMAGPSFGLKQAIDEGLLEGPRMFPSGAMISQTSGHADFRQRGDTPQRRWSGRIDALERLGYALVADGPDEVAAGAREQLRLGATQLKLAAGGGVTSSSRIASSSSSTSSAWTRSASVCFLRASRRSAAVGSWYRAGAAPSVGSCGASSSSSG